MPYASDSAEGNTSLIPPLQGYTRLHGFQSSFVFSNAG